MRTPAKAKMGPRLPLYAFLALTAPIGAFFLPQHPLSISRPARPRDASLTIHHRLPSFFTSYSARHSSSSSASTAATAGDASRKSRSSSFRDNSSRKRTPPPLPPLPQPPAQLRVVVTAFGPFQGVASNPSETLARQLGEEVSTPKGITDLSTHILETSAIGSLTELQQIHTSLTTDGLKQDDNLLLVHLGVRNDIEGFRLENVGYNEASFDFPDERAFQPWNEAVSPTNPDTSFSLFSTLPLHAMTRALHAKSPAGAGYSRQEVSISSNPGRFVCNFLYFHSLEMCRVRGHAHSAALFVHLPPFTRITEEIQFEFLERVLEMAACHFPQSAQEGVAVGRERGSVGKVGAR